MSSYEKYDFARFLFERSQAGSSRLGSLRLGSARLGRASSSWVPIQVASFNYSSSYDPDPLNTLIVGQETATCALKFYGDPGSEYLLFCGDKVRATYDGHPIFLGLVESTKTTTSVDPEAQRHGATHVVEQSCNLVGAYAAALDHEVTWIELPSETVIDRIRRWITVDGW